ncbi:cupin domain-containing protein [Rosenbergiella australiborealis]|uniref:Cupin domain-containing protein n=1 Tax=Rosenbergiella australiborealis TaxID=1544696 RepID=A0ABS5T610_9GAMM|nr:cupin domain-containing protein [Rosenbergiella australiborealis]MBT0727188.1 cupin domain-containing protein [Rosenbergiella australiborealis]
MIDKESAEHYIWGDHCDGWYLLKQQDLLIIHEKMPAHTAEQRHYHHRARQFFFVLSGQLTMVLQDKVHCLHPQQGIEIPPLSPHQACNRSDMAVEFLVISQPSTQGDRENIDTDDEIKAKA